LANDVTPVWASDYSRIIIASRKARLFHLPKAGFFFKHDGSIPTLRSADEEGKKNPDLKRC